MMSESTSTTLTSSASSASFAPFDSPTSPGISETPELLKIVPHPELLTNESMKITNLCPGVFVGPQDSKNPPNMTFPLEESVEYEVLGKALEDAINTQIENRCVGEELKLDGEEGSEAAWENVDDNECWEECDESLALQEHREMEELSAWLGLWFNRRWSLRWTG